MNELVAVYIYDLSVEYSKYSVYACYNNINDYDDRKVSFYDVYQDNECVNEGEPFYEMPSWNDIYEYYWLPLIREGKDNLRDLNHI